MEIPEKQLSKTARTLNTFVKGVIQQAEITKNQKALFFVNRNSNKEFNFTQNVDQLKKVIKLQELIKQKNTQSLYNKLYTKVEHHNNINDGPLEKIQSQEIVIKQKLERLTLGEHRKKIMAKLVFNDIEGRSFCSNSCTNSLTNTKSTEIDETHLKQFNLTSRISKSSIKCKFRCFTRTNQRSHSEVNNENCKQTGFVIDQIMQNEKIFHLKKELKRRKNMFYVQKSNNTNAKFHSYQIYE